MQGSPERLTSAGGVLFFLLLGFVCSAHPGHVRWRHVVWGISIQFVMGLAVLRWDVSEDRLYPPPFNLLKMMVFFSNSRPGETSSTAWALR